MCARRERILLWVVRMRDAAAEIVCAEPLTLDDAQADTLLRDVDVVWHLRGIVFAMGRVRRPRCRKCYGDTPSREISGAARRFKEAT